jgi:hypothetical protein
MRTETTTMPSQRRLDWRGHLPVKDFSGTDTRACATAISAESRELSLNRTIRPGPALSKTLCENESRIAPYYSTHLPGRTRRNLLKTNNRCTDCSTQDLDMSPACDSQTFLSASRMLRLLRRARFFSA